MSNSHRIEAWGFSGGIWLLWRNNVCVEIKLQHFQFLHFSLRVDFGEMEFTGVYGSPQLAMHCYLWENLCQLASYVQSPWYVAGDFNAILSADEIRGSTTSLRRCCRRFQNCMDTCSLEDLGYQGPQFTWHRGLVWERLDRALANQSWLQTFPSAQVFHLPTLCSDHCPLLIDLGVPQQPVPLQGLPFRFQIGMPQCLVVLFAENGSS
ncbi:hypothetical protein Tsubulata_036399 [Turnera subulata]|uniref:Endonuclease/exonuclease/phosphatase domain-containing protein n=1 Tax=Turnera subulata TaxID=218843 RepID=A0A9Q0JJI5_9ROSI|nr:hypothetical protein Tsubulata_036399 [Turnera subulata]